MKKWCVQIPIISIEVEAGDEESALDRVWELYDDGWGSAGFAVTWEAISKVTEGNVCHAELNEQCATEIKHGK